MRLLFISEYYPKSSLGDVHGGVEFRVFQLSQILSHNHIVSVIASSEIGKPAFQKIGLVNVYRVGFQHTYTRSGSIWARVSFVFAAFVLALRLDFDLVEGSSFFAWLPAWMSATLKKRKKIILIADTVSYYGQNIAWVARKILLLFERLLFNLTWDGAIVISKTVQKKLSEYTLKNQVKVIPCGVIMPKKSSHKNKIFTVCCVSRLVPYKDVEILIRAVHLLFKMGNELQLIIIGDGEQKNQLESLTRNLRTDDNVMFYGFMTSHEKVIHTLSASHLFCLPSRVEGFGIATIEAFSCSIPVVLADLPIHHEVTRNKGALFFNPGDFLDLANKILYLLENARYRNKLAREGYHVAHSYQWPQIACDTIEYYERLCTD